MYSNLQSVGFMPLLLVAYFVCVSAATRPFAQHVSSSHHVTRPSSSSNSGSSITFNGYSRHTRSSRRLLGPTACAASSSKLLTNGFFSLSDAHSLNNVLVAATMANDAYPFTRSVGGVPLMEVVDGLTPAQVAVYQRKVRNKYLKLGATSVKFVRYYSPTKEYAAHAFVIGTPKSVFLVYRGTIDLGQLLSSMNTSVVVTEIYSKTLQIYQAPYHSVMGAWPDVLTAVQTAVAATENPSAAQVFLTGHSLGGASASLAALLLDERGYKIGGVYSFGPYKAGTTCSPADDCWVTVYDRHLGGVTQFWWNNQDPIPALLDYADGTTNGSSKWGHVPINRGWVRIVGDACVPSSGTSLTAVCPPEIDAVDGQADGQCTQTTVDPHTPWQYLTKVARCAMQEDFDPTAAALAVQAADVSRDPSASRMSMCSKTAIWADLLVLPAPTRSTGAADSAASSSTGTNEAGITDGTKRVTPGP